MDYIDISSINENSIIKIITNDKNLVLGNIKLIDKNYLGISLPKKQRMENASTIELVLIENEKLVKCKANVLGSKITDLEQVFLISIPEIITIIERRKFERISLVTPVEYSLLPENIDYNSIQQVNPMYYRLLKKTYSVDISAGGINIVTPRTEIISPFALITLQVNFEKIVTIGRSVRTCSTDDDLHNHTAFEYVDIKARHRQLILDYINEKVKVEKEKEKDESEKAE